MGLVYPGLFARVLRSGPRTASVPKDQDQNDDRYRDTEKPEKNAPTHRCLLFQVRGKNDKHRVRVPVDQAFASNAPATAEDQCWRAGDSEHDRARCAGSIERRPDHLADRLLLRLSRANGPARPAVCSYPGAATAAQWAKSAVGKEGLGECATILVTSLVCWFSARSAHER